LSNFGVSSPHQVKGGIPPFGNPYLQLGPALRRLNKHTPYAAACGSYKKPDKGYQTRANHILRERVLDRLPKLRA